MKAVYVFALSLSLQLSIGAQAAPPPATTPTASASAQAAQAGVRTCLPALEKLEAWLTREQSGNAVAFWDNAAADKNLFSAMLTLENKTSNSLANLNVVPSPDGQCVVEYTQTGYAAQTCTEYYKGLGNSARFVRDLNSKTALLQGQGVQILLSPAGQGCLWMRKEIVKQPATVGKQSAAAKQSGKTPAKSAR